MNTEKRCIFHIPYKIDPNVKSGTNIRPVKMKEAFEANEYKVDCIWGYGRERKERISAIKKKIQQGVVYDFVYSENNTMPTALTEKDHIPRYFNLDFEFFKYCKKNGIKISLFYRDIYWKFDLYKEKTNRLQQMIAIPLYKYDLRQYDKFVDRLYLPSNKMRPYVENVKDFSELPPGCEINEEVIECKKKQSPKESLELFYVGGIGSLYDIKKLLQTVIKFDNVRLTVCCRENEWITNKERYQKYVNNNISIIHKSGKELDEYYKKADISLLYFPSDGYRSFAMPVKLFEYMGNLTPIIATCGSAAGEFVELNDIGWNISYNDNSLEKLLAKILKDRKLLIEKRNNLASALQRNTWKARAAQVIDDLTKGEGK